MFYLWKEERRGGFERNVPRGARGPEHAGCAHLHYPSLPRRLRGGLPFSPSL